ncbi:MAG: TIGR04283 family arsenosugar biosynthesis glycosyltransferase [Pseudorhodoplanes sp.]|nr:TIGR04283 family arsenosugar biosynthesis glycosyltransferase [Pseudorhodoplanes sp.]
MTDRQTGSSDTPISVVVPALNEGIGLGRFLAGLTAAGFHEIVVVDNGSTDDTLRVASRHRGVRVEYATGGRGPALNAGARATTAEYLLFVHADTALPPGAAATINAAFADANVAGGCFRLSFDNPSALLRFYGWFTRFDTAFTTFGDQAYFVRRGTFEDVGGFPNWPIMEDVEFRRRLKRAGRFVKLSGAVVTSARRFDERGAVRQQLENFVLMILYYLGLPPQRIARWYRAEPPAPASTKVCSPP